MEKKTMENINSQYLSNDQIKIYLEACLDQKVQDFKVLSDKISSTNNIDLSNKDEFERLKDSKKFPEQDNLFYRVWIYQYEGLKELLKENEEQVIIRNNNNRDEEKQTKNIDKEKKNLSFRFTFGKIDIKDLQKENLFYQQLTENPNVNFDEYKPTENEISSQRKNLKIIFLYVNLGTPLLEEDCEVEEIEEINPNKKRKEKYKYYYKYEFDIDRIVYYRNISFSLYEENENISCVCELNIKLDYYWILEDKEIGLRKYYCPNCFSKLQDKENYKLIENTKYSIRYFLFCHEPGHNTKKYEYYCTDCKRPYCVKCLITEHAELNEKHNLIRINSRENDKQEKEKDVNKSNNDKLDVDSKIFCKDKIKEINRQKIKNDKIWEEINDAGDKAELSLRERESKAIVEVKNEVLARCTFLTSLGYELQRMIGELDFKTKFIQDLKKDSNVSSYLNMNNMLLEDLKNHYIPNLEKIEGLPLDKFLETFHKIDKKYPFISDDEEENESFNS